MNGIVNIEQNYQTNSSVHSINMRNKHRIYWPNASLSCFQKSALFVGSGIVSRLPRGYMSLKNEKAQFKAVLRRYLNTHCFCCVEEFLYDP
jgi:hypothetical protein